MSHVTFTKPAKGSGWLASKQRASDRKAHERREMDAAKVRDGHRCRWPECEFMAKKPRIEAAHAFEHRGMGGNKDGTKTERRLCVTLCFIHHAELDRAGIGIEALTDAMADGPLAFYERQGEGIGRLEHIASETTRGVSVSRT